MTYTTAHHQRTTKMLWLLGSSHIFHVYISYSQWSRQWKFFRPFCFCQVDAETSPDEVFAQICQVMETFWFLVSSTPPPTSGPWVKTSSPTLWLLYRSKEICPHNPHTCTRHMFLELQQCACPRHFQLSVKLLSAFDTDKAPGCHILPYPLALSLPTALTSIYAANCQA